MPASIKIDSAASSIDDHVNEMLLDSRVVAFIETCRWPHGPASIALRACLGVGTLALLMTSNSSGHRCFGIAAP